MNLRFITTSQSFTKNLCVGVGIAGVLLTKRISMDQNRPDNLGSFISTNKTILKEYLEARMEIYRLQSLRIFSKSAGYLAWVLVSAFLGFLIVVFGGLMLGYWFSSMFGSFVKGFGLVTLLLLVIFILLVLFRKPLFVDPVVQSIIQKAREEEDEKEEDD
jgi:hypothetical protein